MTITSAIEGLVIASIEHSWLDQTAKLRSLTNPDTGGPMGGYAYQHAEAYLYESLYNRALVWIAAREGVKTHPLTPSESSI